MIYHRIILFNEIILLINVGIITTLDLYGVKVHRNWYVARDNGNTNIPGCLFFRYKSYLHRRI